METILKDSGMDKFANLNDGFTMAGAPYFAGGPAKLAWNMIMLIRENPCKMVPLWEKSPTNFILEFARWLNVAGGFVADITNGTDRNANSRYYSIIAANIDPAVFPEPLRFDPTRKNLHRTLSFNALESELRLHDPKKYNARHPKGSTLHRHCMGRQFTVRWLTDIVPKFVSKLKVQCSSPSSSKFGAVQKIGGMSWETDTESVAGGHENLEVYKSINSHGQTRLVIALHDHPWTPLSFGRLAKELGAADFAMWAPVLPGWAPSSPLVECTLESSAERIRDLISKAYDSGSWTQIYLLGSGLRGELAWVAAGGVPKGKLDGLIIMSAAHPYVGRGSHAGETLGQFHGGKQFQPIVRTLVNKPQSVVRQFENESWYTREY
jgi:hypothetical protein